jgi:hypothetical protein
LTSWRLEDLIWIGVDEISYRRGQRYLTSVADRRSGAIVWSRAGRNSATLAEFFDQLGDRRHSIRAVSIDMSGAYQRAIRDAVPQAEICFDPFHVVRLAARDRPGPPRRMERPRALPHRDRALGQRHPLVAAQGPRTPDGRPARAPVRSSARQPPALPRLPAARRTAAALPPRRPHARAGAPRRLAHLGQPLAAQAVRPPRAHPASTATASSPRSASGSPTAAWKASTAKSGSSATAATASTQPTHSSRSSTSAAPASSSTCRDELHPQLDRSALFTAAQGRDRRPCVLSGVTRRGGRGCHPYQRHTRGRCAHPRCT